MGAGAEKRGLLLHLTSDVEDVLATLAVIQSLFPQPPGPFQPEDPLNGEAGALQLVSKLLRTMEIGRRKEVGPRRAEVATLGEVALDDRPDLPVADCAADQRVEQRRKSRDRSGSEETTGPEHAPCLGECRHAISPFDQVVERAEQKNDLVARVGLVEAPRVSLGDLESPPRALGRRSNVKRRRIDELDRVSPGGQPVGVCPRPASDIENTGRRGRQEAGENLLCPNELDQRRTTAQTVELDSALVVVANLVVHASRL